jgi:hypothetical protein
VDKAVVSGRDVQVIAFDNYRFQPVMRRAIYAKLGKPADDYRLKENEFPAWFFGPNALQITKETIQTDRDRRENAATVTLEYQRRVDIVASFLRTLPAEARQEFLDDVENEAYRLDRLNPRGKIATAMKAEAKS